MIFKYCRKCGVELTDENWIPSRCKVNDRMCRNCCNEQAKGYRANKTEEQIEKDCQYRVDNRDRIRENTYRYRYKNGTKSMDKNPDCPLYLGVVIAERILSEVFKDVEVMPNNNPGYDFICNKGFKIDVKSACRRKDKIHSKSWLFTIRRNKIPDYFLCLAFDNRDDLNPEHIWLIPASDVNGMMGAAISETTLWKWNEYRINKIEQITECCNTLRNK